MGESGRALMRYGGVVSSLFLLDIAEQQAM